MSIRVTGEAELRSLIRTFNKWSRRSNVLATFDEELEELGRTTVDEIQTRVLATPSKGQNARRGRRSLRAAIARAAEYSRRQSDDISFLSIRVDPDEMLTDDRSLPSLYEGLSPWMHPVYGEEPVVRQEPHPYFRPATAGIEEDAVSIAERGIDKIADDIENDRG